MRNTRAGKYERTSGRMQFVPCGSWRQEKANMRKERKYRKERKQFKHFRRPTYGPEK